jgi:myo-inositol-1(or 4)-monophosphatase
LSSPLLEAVISAVHDAGCAIADVRSSAQLQSTETSGRGPVAQATRAADYLLRHYLPSARAAAWLAEETVRDSVRLEQDSVWVVDPLSGTGEFVAGLPEFAVSVGLVQRGRCVLGVIHQPVTGHTWWAEQGAGAFLDGAPIRVRQGRTLLASHSDAGVGEFAGMSGWDVTPMDSIALELAYVACGRGAAAVSRGSKWEWNVCAGSLIVREAGGACTDMFGGIMDFNKPHPKVRGVVAGSAEAAAVVLGQLARIAPSERMKDEGLRRS